jgi:chemotaxis protein CheD
MCTTSRRGQRSRAISLGLLRSTLSATDNGASTYQLEAAFATGKASQMVIVCLADVGVRRVGEGDLMARGVGACVAVCMMDAEAGVLGMALTSMPATSAPGSGDSSTAASSLAECLVKKMCNAGGDPSRLVAAISGGASLLLGDGLGFLADLGSRNAEECRRALAELKIPLLAEDVGGNCGRTVRLVDKTGDVVVQKAGVPEMRLIRLSEAVAGAA